MTSRNTNKPRRDIHQEVTDNIIAELNAGRLPWLKPWSGGDGVVPGQVMPRNAVSGRAYSGINLLLLWSAGYQRPVWLTFKQAKEAGGCVRKGERGCLITYWADYVPKEEREDAEREGRAPGKRRFMKHYYVFNVDQVDDLPAKFHTPPEPKANTVEEIEAIAAATGATIRHGEAKAFYSRAGDYVMMPAPECFAGSDDYYSTLFHELAHWTGAPHRLARAKGAVFGNSDYAREELVAEMSAAFTGAEIGYTPRARHSDYIASWLSVLNDDKRAIFWAASRASKATAWILDGAEAADNGDTVAPVAQAA